jgi:hypothetical protein
MVTLDQTHGLEDPVLGFPKYLDADPLETTLAFPVQSAKQALDIVDVTAYPAPPLVGIDAGRTRLRDDPLVAVLPRPRPDGVAEALAEAICSHDQAEVQRILVSGADANAAPIQGRHADVKPLALAVRGTGTVAILRLLLESGAEARCTTTEPGLNSALQAWTITFVDPSEHLVETRAKLRLLLECSADVNARILHSGDTALHRAAEEFQRRRAEGSSHKINRWTTKRMDCAKMKFSMLLQAGADPAARNRRNQSPLDLVSPNFRGELPSQDDACREPL